MLSTVNSQFLSTNTISLFTAQYVVFGGPGSSVGIVTDYGLGGPGSNPGGARISSPVQTGPGAHQPTV